MELAQYFIDGVPVDSCMYLAIWADKKKILTIEGVAKDGKLSNVQQAYIDEGAIQCGFCTPGLVLTTTALVNSGKEYTDEEIKRELSGGHTLSIPEVITSSAQVSNLKWLNSNKVEEKLTTAELFYLATKGGGKLFGKVGSFEEDYEFDALIIDDSDLLIENNLSIEEILQKFLYIGNSNNIIERYVSGNLINEPIL